MASNLKVDIVRPTATNGSLSLKGDSGGSATTNGVTVNSSGNTSITGTTTVSSLVATTADINGGTIDGTDITVGSGKTLDVSAGTLALANDQISGDAIDGGSASLDSLDVIPPASDAVLTVGSSSVNGKHRVNVTGGGTNFFGYYLSGKPTLIKYTSDQSILRIGSDGTDTTTQSQRFYTDGTERMRINSSGNVGAAKFTDIAGTGAPDFPNGQTVSAGAEATPSITPTGDTNTGIYFPAADTVGVSTAATERMRIDGSGNVRVGNSLSTAVWPSVVSASGVNEGKLTNDGVITSSTNSSANIFLNRNDSDGDLINFYSTGTKEGSISVSGTTVSYNGGHLARWSQLLDSSKDESIVKGTVMTNLNEMCEWSHPDEYWTEEDELPEGISVGDLKNAAYTEENEQLNRMAVSSVEGDTNVAGVFVNWDSDEDGFNDMKIAMTGDMVIRIAQNVVVNRGDLLMSAGDGTAKPQGDDIVRSKTIAKVTSTYVSKTYQDGSYLVPCVLMAC